MPKKERLASIAPQPKTQPPPPVLPVTPSTDSGQSQTIWHVPYRQNPFFTGREQLLERLHNNLTARKAAALTQAQAINGLGGIGKTQVAIEYAYRHRENYQYSFWVNAATRETLIADYVDIAKRLHLPEQNEQDQNIIVKAVIAWLATQNDCLLILDNADDLYMIDPFVSAANACHILITTRTQATNALAQSIEVEKMAIPGGDIDVIEWTQCQRYVAHAQTCATFIEQYHLAFPEDAHLLNQTAIYLYAVALYTEAEPLYQRAIAIDEKTLGSIHPNLAIPLNNLALLYERQGKYEQAEPLYQRALQIVEKRLDPNHPFGVTVRKNYAQFLEEKRQRNEGKPRG